MRFLLARGRRPRHDEVVDVVIVNLRAIVDSWLGDMKPDIVDDVCHNLAILLVNGGRALLDQILGGG